LAKCEVSVSLPITQKAESSAYTSGRPEISKSQVQWSKLSSKVNQTVIDTVLKGVIIAKTINSNAFSHRASQILPITYSIIVRTPPSDHALKEDLPTSFSFTIRPVEEKSE
jgi:hypothetical protein